MTEGNEQLDAPPSAPGLAARELPPLLLPQPPRSGDLTIGWRIVTGVVWVAVAAALAAVWSASVQLGLATWWLGPRSDQQPVIIRLLPFVPSALMVLAAINQIRRLPLLGLVAAGSIAVVGLVDLGYVRGLAVVELAIAAAAGLVSAASSTGTYRETAVDTTSGPTG